VIREVTEQDTAQALGSGDVPVLATPRLIQWLEAATVEAARPFLGAGQTSVGTAVRIRHLRAASVGARVRLAATAPPSPDGRRLTFAVSAVDEAGGQLADGEIERAIVDRARFPGAVTDS
jgi:fluoroacetyl-CoA thioesterase